MGKQHNRRIFAGFYKRYDGKFIYVVAVVPDVDTGEQVVIFHEGIDACECKYLSLIHIFPVQKKGVYSADLLFGQLLHDRGAAANHGGVRHITVVSQSGPSVGRAALYGDPCVFLQANPMSMNIMEEL